MSVRSIKLLRPLVAALFVCAIALLLVSCGGSGLGGSGSLGGSTNPSGSAGAASTAPPRDNTPVVLTTEQPGTAVAGDGNATLDYSNASEGYVCVSSNLGDTQVRILVNSPSGNQYQYNVDATGVYINIPLTEGSGTYTLGVYKHLSGTSFAALFSQDVDAQMADENKPFLYPSQYVDFASGDAAVTLAQQVTDGAITDVDAVNGIYIWVVENINYDYDKAASVQPGYLPNNTDTLNTKTGICFDFASLSAAMMRSQRLPTKLEVGYAGQAYHAWIEVYTTDQGVIRQEINFPGNAWVRLDPTFDSAGKGSGDIRAIVGDGSTYQVMFYY